MKKIRVMRHLIGMVIIPILLLQITFKVTAADLNGEVFTKSVFDYTITQAATLKTEGNVNIKINNRLGKLIEFVKVPETVKYHNLNYKVTKIDDFAFSNCNNLTKVIIPQSVTSIGVSVFEQCSKLKYIIISDSVTNIDKNAFINSSTELCIYGSKDSAAYNFTQSNNMSYKVILFNKNNRIVNTDKKLVIVGDSRTNNMSQWVKASVSTQFVSKNGKGYRWFCQEGIDKVNAITQPGDDIILWLGVNDYFCNTFSDNSWAIYANRINSLAVNEWSDCKVYVASVGYVDRGKLLAYYGENSRSNVTQLPNGNQLKGIQEFNKKLKAELNNNINWINISNIIGINSNDNENTSDDIWLTKANGTKDGLHYGQSKTQEIYNYFVRYTLLD